MPPASIDFSRITTGQIPEQTPRPKTGKIPEKKRWTFAFRYWRQIEKFGVGDCQNSWFISLLERFKSLCEYSVEEFLASHSDQDSIRFHEINWGARNIPISKKDIDWLGPTADSEDFEFVQFHVSKALGRVVGFFDAEQVFQVVLFDPMHNIQPSGTYGYRVRITHAGRCELTRVVARFERSISRATDIGVDAKKALLHSMHTDYADASGGAIIFNVNDEDIAAMLNMLACAKIDRIGSLIEFVLAELAD